MNSCKEVILGDMIRRKMIKFDKDLIMQAILLLVPLCTTSLTCTLLPMFDVLQFKYSANVSSLSLL